MSPLPPTTPDQNYSSSSSQKSQSVPRGLCIWPQNGKRRRIGGKEFHRREEQRRKNHSPVPRGQKIERYKRKKLGRGGGGEKTQSVPRGLYMWPQNEERKCLKIVAKIWLGASKHWIVFAKCISREVEGLYIFKSRKLEVVVVWCWWWLLLVVRWRMDLLLVMVNVVGCPCCWLSSVVCCPCC